MQLAVAAAEISISFRISLNRFWQRFLWVEFKFYLGIDLNSTSSFTYYGFLPLSPQKAGRPQEQRIVIGITFSG